MPARALHRIALALAVLGVGWAVFARVAVAADDVAARPTHKHAHTHAAPPTQLAPPETAPAAKAPVAKTPAAKAAKAAPAAASAEPVRTVEATITLPGVGGDALAAFVRNGALWIVAEGDSQSVLPRLTGPGSRDLGTIERVTAQGATVFRVPIPGDLGPMVSRPGKDWVVELTRNPPDTPLPDSGIVDDRGYLALAVAMPGIGAPISLTDPDVGDTLLVSPTPLGIGYAKGRRFAEFDIVPAVQGLVVAPRAEGLALVADNDRAMIGTPAGLKLSSVPEKTAQSAEATSTGPASSTAMALASPAAAEIHDPRILLDWIGWHLPTREPDAAREDLEHHAAVMDDPHRAAALLDLARLMLSQGRAPETLGYLDLALAIVPNLDAKDDVRMLRAASLALLGRGDQAKDDLTHAGVEGTSDCILWKGLVAAQAAQWQGALGFFKAGIDRLPAYPDALFRPLTLAMIESAIRSHDVATARTMIEQLRERPDPAHLVQAALAYFDGQLAALGGRDEEAQTDWAPVLKGRDQYYRTRAELASVLVALKSKAIQPDAAIDRLYRLQFTWRGDGFETEVLQSLADIASGAKDFETAQVAWRRIETLSGPGPVADAAQAKLVDAFRQLFIDGGADQLPPLRALALFDEMHDLAPQGADGDKALDRLAERMVQMDLLDQAADIIEGEAGHQSDIEAKGKLGARSAALRLLANKPELAVRALDASEASSQSAELQGDRKLLRARAYAKLGRGDDAMALLGSDSSPAADSLRVDISWDAQRWRAAADALGRLVGPAPGPGLLDEAKTNLVLRRAVALNLAQDQPGLAVLRRDFAASFAQGKHASEFEVLTKPSGSGTLANLDIIKSDIAVVDMFKDFLAAYRTPAGGA